MIPLVAAFFEALWPEHPETQIAMLLVLLAAALAFFLVVLPMLLRLVRAWMLARRLRRAVEGGAQESARSQVAEAMSGSFLADQWAEFDRRWREVASAADGAERVAVRFGEVIDERPLIPYGVRRSLLGGLPGTFIALGVLGTFIGLTIATTQMGEASRAGEPAGVEQAIGTPALSSADRASAAVAQLTSNLGLAFRTSVLGLVFSIFFSILLRSIEGASQAREAELERLVERAFPPATDAEVEAQVLNRQADLFDSLKLSLTDLMTEYQELSRAGFEQVRKSLEAVTSNVSEGQRAALDQVARDLNDSLKEGIGTYLSDLRTALQEAVQQQTDLSARVREAFDRIDDSVMASRAAATELTTAAGAVGTASTALASCATDLSPAVENISAAGGSLERTANSIAASQEAASQTVSEVGRALEQAQGSLEQQRTMVETSLGELRASIQQLSEGLAEDLVGALGRIDGLMETALGRLSGTVGESNETLDRLARPLGELDDAVGRVSESIDRSAAEVGGLASRLDERLARVGELGTALETYAQSQTAAQESLMKLLREAEGGTEAVTGLGKKIAAQAEAQAMTNESLQKMQERFGDLIALLREQQRRGDERPEVAAIGQLSSEVTGRLDTLGEKIQEAMGAGAEAARQGASSEHGLPMREARQPAASTGEGAATATKRDHVAQPGSPEPVRPGEPGADTARDSARRPQPSMPAAPAAPNNESPGSPVVSPVDTAADETEAPAKRRGGLLGRILGRS